MAGVLRDQFRTARVWAYDERMTKVWGEPPACRGLYRGQSPSRGQGQSPPKPNELHKLPFRTTQIRPQLRFCVELHTKKPVGWLRC